MLIGVPKELKPYEFRVGLTPSSVHECTMQGHSVIIESGAGAGIRLDDVSYREAGAEIVASATTVYEKADLIVKVKEPLPAECGLLRPGQILFTYLHLAAMPDLATQLQASRCIAIAYETVTDERGGLPLLAPMSEVAGRMSIQAGATSLERTRGGSGILLGGVPGVPPAHVVILGGGVVGSNAVKVAIGMGARVTVLDKSIERLNQLDKQFGSQIVTIYSTLQAVEKYVSTADIVVGAVLVPGATAPKIISKALVKKMRPGSVLVDVSIDQGGCFETSRPTTHADPTYLVDEIVHYCVTNMPGAVPRTSTFALNNATLPFVLAIANQGYQKAMQLNPYLRSGLNICEGQLTHPAVAQALHQPYVSPDAFLSSI